MDAAKPGLTMPGMDRATEDAFVRTLANSQASVIYPAEAEVALQSRTQTRNQG
jgi:hypothetical protein